MLISVRPQSDSSLELEPVNSTDREYIRKCNPTDNTCIAYLEDAIIIDSFKAMLSDEQLNKLDDNKRAEVDIDIYDYIMLLVN